MDRARLPALAATDTISVSDTDPSHYFGIGPAIDIVKSPDVGEVPMGDPWTFTITVTNTGDVALTGVVVTDPQVPACDRTLGDLAPRQSTTYTCDVEAVEEELLNVASVMGRTRAGVVVTDSDDAKVTPVPVDETVDKANELNAGQDLADTGADAVASLIVALLGMVLIGAGLRLSANRR